MISEGGLVMFHFIQRKMKAINMSGIIWMNLKYVSNNIYIGCFAKKARQFICIWSIFMSHTKRTFSFLKTWNRLICLNLFYIMKLLYYGLMLVNGDETSLLLRVKSSLRICVNCTCICIHPANTTSSSPCFQPQLAAKMYENEAPNNSRTKRINMQNIYLLICRYCPQALVETKTELEWVIIDINARLNKQLLSAQKILLHTHMLTLGQYIFHRVY